MKYVKRNTMHIYFNNKIHLFRVQFEANGNVMLGNVVLDRDISGFIITTAVPTVIANMIGHATNFFAEDLFDAAIGVNLTILLVLTTMLAILIFIQFINILI